LTDPTPDADRSLDLTDATIDDEVGGRVEETVNALLKAARARQTYVLGNPLIEQFTSELCEKLVTLWDELPHLSLDMDEGNLLWRDRKVYSKAVGPDNFAFRFFKDGIRRLAFLPGAEEEELAEFMEILALSRQAHDDDLLATLWHRDFKTIRMEYVDVTDEEVVAVPRPDRNAGAGEHLENMEEIDAVLESGAIAEEEAEEFSDITLAEPDLLYLKREMESEWARPVLQDVINSK
jgi:hypothetical protein